MDESQEGDWHQIQVEEAIERLEVDPAQGLSDAEARRRLEKFGPNEIAQKGAKNGWLLLLEQFRQPLIYILLIVAVISFLIGEVIDGWVIFGVAAINALVGFIQEFKAEKAIEALAKSLVGQAHVLREGSVGKFSSKELVPGDIVLLQAGDGVPADMRLIQVKNLQIDESALTGESVPVEKGVAPAEEEAPLAEQGSMVFAGTLVTKGSARAVVTSTGQGTETGKISEMMVASASFETPLTNKIRQLSTHLLYFILFMSALLFGVALLKGMTWIKGFQGAVALAVSAIPEGLPAAITVVLAIGVSRMAKRHAIIRKLPAVETLGSTTVICSDKTGTLTLNEMRVQQLCAVGQSYQMDDESAMKIFDEKPALRECLNAAVLCNDAHLKQGEEKLEMAGDPTEGALLILGHQAGLSKKSMEEKHPRLDSIPFESEKQYMASLHEGPSGNILYAKGSIESLLERCGKTLDEKGNVIKLDKEKALDQAHSMAKEGLRVLSFAKKEVSAETTKLDGEASIADLIYLGCAGLIDPPRPEAIQAVRVVQGAGIKVKMLTGDHVHTAQAIAKKIGLIHRDDEVFSGKELSSMTDEEFLKAARKGSVFARVAPEHKLRLVKALKSHHEIVAVTGDGVNDAPALKAAHIGVAMGIMGTEVAKEAADMVLTDDNFASIEAAVEEGRTVYTNLLKIIGFILPVNCGEALTIFAGLLIVRLIPILPVQILWINMVSSVALMLTLAFEPKLKNVMKRPPLSPNQKILSPPLIVRVSIISLYNLLATFGGFELALWLTGDIVLSRTVAVNTLVSAETFYLLSISECVPSLFAYIRDQSTKIAYAPLIGILCIVVIQYAFSQWSAMNFLFHTAPLSWPLAALCLAAGFFVLAPALTLRRFTPIIPESVEN